MAMIALHRAATTKQGQARLLVLACQLVTQ